MQAKPFIREMGKSEFFNVHVFKECDFLRSVVIVDTR